MDLNSKAEEINLVLAEPDVNLWKLRELCLTEGGLVNDTLRRRAWPKLVGVHALFVPNENPGPSPRARNMPPRPPRPSSVTSNASLLSSLVPPVVMKATNPTQKKAAATVGPIPDSLDAEQISRDVARCTWHLLTGTQRSRHTQMKNKHRKKVAYLLRKKQKRLGNLINLTLLRTYEESDVEKLRYYQGYHDVASIFLCTLGGGRASSSWTGEPNSVSAIASAVGLDLPRAVLAQVSFSHFRDAMQSNFVQLQTAIRLLLMPLICYFDPEVHDFLYACDMEPYFALSWIITWFAHDIRDTALVKRIFDAFLVSHPLLPIYAAVAMVCHHYNRSEVLSVECDFASVHSTLANLPKNSSMVGWRYRPTGEGYESGDDTDDEGSVATMEISFSLDSHPFEGRDDEDETHSMVSSQISTFSRAPFEEILESALAFMRRIPPSRLIPLATRYHAAETIEPMLNLTPSIELLKPHPKWGLVSSTPADWVLKQRARQREGRKSTRRDRRHRSASRSNSRTRSSKESRQGPPSCKDKETHKFSEKQKQNLAVIACGFGYGDEEEIRRRKRRRQLLWGSIAAGMVAIFVGVVMNTGMMPSFDDHATSGREQQRELEVSTTANASSRNIAANLMKFSDNTAADNIITKMTSKTILSKSNSNVQSNAIVPVKEAKVPMHPIPKPPSSRARIAPESRARSAPVTATNKVASSLPYRDASRPAKKYNDPNPIAAIPAVIIIIKTFEFLNRIIRGSMAAIAIFVKSLREKRVQD